MTVILGDTVKVTARLKWANAVDIQNVFTARMTTGFDIPDDDAKADMMAWLELMYTEVIGAMPTNLVFEDADFFNLTQGVPMGIDFWPVLTTGTGGTTEIAATGVAAVITAFTGLSRVRGRKFFGPLTEAAIDAGVLNNATMTTMAAIIALWITPFVGDTSGVTWTPGVWQRLTDTFAAFRDAVVRNIPGYQRRRKAGVGS
jgi:hypothetical protein